MGKFKLCITGDLGFEVWQDIPGYEGLYQASTYGRVRSLDRIASNGQAMILYKGRTLSLNLGTDGYYHTSLYRDGRRKQVSVHVILASIFLPKRFGKTQVNHKDEKKLNNTIDNLEWMSPKENANYGTRNIRVIKTKKERGLIKKVSMIDLEGNFIKSFDSILEAADFVHGKSSNICCCCNNKAKTAYGYKWRYE